MSAYAGTWNIDGRPTDRNFLAKLNAVIAQYGPDGDKIYFDGSVGMLYCAFQTTPESQREHQPHVSSRGLVLSWDGRLDNRDELIDALREGLLADETDPAIIAAAFEHWGTDCFHRLIGDWAVTIWNPSDMTLVLARDFVGVRHLYYYMTPEKVVWCTHLGALVMVSNVPFVLNDEYVLGYLALWPEAHLTPYRGVHAVPPGKFVRIHNDGRAKIHSYWAFDPNKRTRYKNDGEYENHFRHIFRQAVRRRLRSDTPILAELSGGLDSSSVVCMADDILARGEASAPYIDTISFYDLKEPGGDDYFYLTKVEQKRGRRGFHIDLGSSELPLGIERSGFSAIPGNPGVGEEGEAKWSEVIRSSKSRVVLSGVGGDEFLGGVPDPRPQLADLVLQFRLGKLIRQLAAWSLAKRRPWIQLFLESLVLLLPNGVRSRFDNQCKGESWIGSSVERQASFATVRFGPRETFGFWLPSRKEYARTLVMIGRELECVNPPKGACFERRYPYLDRTLLEFLISIPADQLLRAGERRSLMRRALAQILPPEVLSRRTKAHPARSYMVPLERRWPEIESVLSSSLCGLRGQIDVGYLRESLVAAKNGKTAHLARLLRVLSLESWLQDVTARGFVTAETKSLFAVGMRTVQSGV